MAWISPEIESMKKDAAAHYNLAAVATPQSDASANALLGIQVTLSIIAEILSEILELAREKERRRMAGY